MDTGHDPEREIRALHDEWFAAARAKDLEASMRPVSPTIVSYEHSAPLQVTGLEGVRAECRRGFELAPADFAWTVPDLQVLAHGDLAVAWGLNRMANHPGSPDEHVTWSRGTRVFRRIGGRWLMVHQHVSFPVDTATGLAATGLVP
ncbi:YybH family protein [Rhabdothermincola sediminis]|uniref:YybH family protein n=1 Tax=Rhabdothermincola sediminis TaxID=2751370 RepID=UPI001AA065F8|nr:nuclear transport factor 2 family protein [Rhabdothermincola sediminis]